MQIGLGELNLNPWELFEYSWEDFVYKIEGRRKVDHMLSHEQWERTRELGWIMAQVSGNLKSGINKYHLMQFSWDVIKPKKSIGQLTGEEQKEAIKRLLENSKDAFKKYLDNKN